MHKPNIANKLRWQCRRGMLELDVILDRLLASTFPYLNEAQQLQFEQMLLTDDPTLYAWLMGTEHPLSEGMRELVVQCRKKIF
jgi:antitoxin CptB